MIHSSQSTQQLHSTLHYTFRAYDRAMHYISLLSTRLTRGVLTSASKLQPSPSGEPLSGIPPPPPSSTAYPLTDTSPHDTRPPFRLGRLTEHSGSAVFDAIHKQQPPLECRDWGVSYCTGFVFGSLGAYSVFGTHEALSCLFTYIPKPSTWLLCTGTTVR